MPNNSGTLVIAPIRPQGTTDTYPSAYASELLGGLHAAADTAARDAIPAVRRVEGMQCFCVSDATTYQLIGGVLNTNWTTIAGSHTHYKLVSPDGLTDPGGK